MSTYKPRDMYAPEPVMQQAPREQQDDLLSILGIFAEPLFDPHQFVSMIGREKLMDSKLLDYLMKEREAEFQEREAELKIQFRQQEEQLRHDLQQLLEDTLLIHFPSTPLAVVRDMRRVENPAELRRLIVEVQRVPDLAAAERLLREAAGNGQE